MENGGSTLLYKMLEDMLALANVVVARRDRLVCTKEKAKQSTAQHGTARQSTTPCCRARQLTVPHGATLRL